MNVFAIRHGETAWSLSGQHTGTTDIPLTENGRRLAQRLRPVLAKETFTLVLVSPLQRTRETCELAGLGHKAVIEPKLVEWNYGKYEGLTPSQINETAPAWLIFRDGCPGGETPEQVGARADRVIEQARAAKGDVALFAHGHVLRVLAARWLGLPPGAGQKFLLDTGTLSVLSYYHEAPAVRIWNGPVPNQLHQWADEDKVMDSNATEQGSLFQNRSRRLPPARHFAVAESCRVRQVGRPLSEAAGNRERIQDGLI